LRVSPRKVAAALGGIVLLAAVLYALFVPRITLGPPQRHGPIAVVQHAGEPRLWVLTKQEERRQVTVGVGRYSTGSVRTDTFYHFDVHVYDTRSAQPAWRRRLLTIGDREAARTNATTSRVVGHSARARILGQDRDAVWLFVHDQPLAVAAIDATPRIGREGLEQRNPQLKALIPAELGFFAFDGGLVVITADGRRVVLRGPEHTAAPYTPASEDQFRRLRFMADQWHGDHRADDFVTRQTTHEGSWLGLFSEREAADASDDGFGDKLKNPARTFNEGSHARRALWSARIGRTRTFTEGAHDRLTDLSRRPDTPDFLQGGFLVRAGTMQALALDDPRGLLVLHRTRLDSQGRVALSRLGPSLAEVWRVTLPFAELTHRWEWPGHLLLYGSAPTGGADGPRGHHEYLVAVELRNGGLRGWNVTTASALP
jgi:hypothetical protein